MKKERIFYLDFIRALSIIIIVTYHFAVHFSNQLVPLNFFRSGKWGLLGVALFFMISGASLQYNYSDITDLKTYYKKRFLGIYPVFWTSYSLIFLFTFWKNKGFFIGLPIYKLGLSVLGMDGYLSTYTPTFYLIGEWFLGCIIIIYLLFPLLQFVMKKFPKILLGVSTAIYLGVILFSNFKMPLNQNLIVSAYSFLLGMYFIKYIKDVKIWQVIAGGTIGILILWTYNIGDPKFMWKAVLQVNLAAYGLFFGLRYLGEKINITWIKNIINKISKYSYIIFLLHHQIIMQVKGHFETYISEKYGMICVYIICWALILILGKFVYILNKKAMQIFSKENGK